MWLQLEADMDFGDTYHDIFKEHYGYALPVKAEAQLWYAGKNIAYAIKAFMHINGRNCGIDSLLKFVEKFISEQLDGFNNDYDTSEWGHSGGH